MVHLNAFVSTEVFLFSTLQGAKKIPRKTSNSVKLSFVLATMKRARPSTKGKEKASGQKTGSTTKKKKMVGYVFTITTSKFKV